MTDALLTIDADGTHRWHLDGRLHRDDGPAVYRLDAQDQAREVQWWCEGVQYPSAQQHPHYERIRAEQERAVLEAALSVLPKNKPKRVILD
jgi:hypothetical protein